MPKINKRTPRQKEIKQREIETKMLMNSMISSSFLTYLLATAFFIVSFLFNGRFITLPGVGESTTSDVFDVIIKSFSVILFFFFMFISFGNLQEFRGYILTWKEMILLLVISLLQASSEVNVFLVSTVGIVIILTYFYFVQGKAEKQ